MNLSAVDTAADPNASWEDVLHASTELIGSDPYTVWTQALADAGSETVGPSANGEHTSTCPNPSHPDSKPSLRWRQAPDGQILFKCHAGCEAQIILDSLGLSFSQLKWAKTQYTYRSDLREILGIKCKSPAPNNKKTFWWEHVENGGQFSGRPAWEPVLWALPDLIETTNRARTSGKKIHLLIAEGEKDAIHVAEAISADWMSPDQPQSDWVHLSTTSADGAASWTRELTDQVLGLAPDQVTILCDSDQTGTQRGTRLIEALREASPTLSVAAINWSGQTGVKDAADAIQSYGKHWLLRALPVAEADIYLWCSTETGWLSEYDAIDVDGTPSGKRTLHRILNPGTPRARYEAISKYPVRVSALTVDIEGKPVGWEIDTGGGGHKHLRTTDLDGSSLEKWNSVAGVFIVSTRSLTAQLRAYLGFHGSNVPSMTVYDHEGWVDDERFVTKTGMLIGPEGESASAALNGDQGADWHYGLSDESEAAEHIAQLLTFRDLTESGPVLAWLAAQAVRPLALRQSGATFVPMLQVPGASGIGKTSFLKLATRLFGFCGNPISNVTSAGLVRTLALTTGVVWIDDFTNYDDTIRDIIRGGITGAGRTRGTTASERGVVRDEVYAALINSGEHAFDVNERAMSQRSVVLEFARSVQGRRSRLDSSRDQYRELEAMGVARDDKGKGLSRYAGSVIRGLWQAAQEIDGTDAGKGSGTGIRGQAAWEFVRYGAHVLAKWMLAAGQPKERVTKYVAEVTEICNREARNAARRERTGADVYLVQEIVPRYLHAARQRMDGAITAYTHSLDPEDVKLAIRASWTAHFGEGPNNAEQLARAVVVLFDKKDEFAEPDVDAEPQALGIAIAADSLFLWATSQDGQRAGVSRDERHISSTGIAMQLKQVANRTIHDGEGTSIRVRLGRAGSVPRYRIITEPEVLNWLTS